MALKRSIAIAIVACLAFPGMANAESDPDAAFKASIVGHVAAEALSKIGIPVGHIGIILEALASTELADPSVDQVTQLNPQFADRTGTDLAAEEADLAKAQEAVKTFPQTPSTVECIQKMQRLREGIKKNSISAPSNTCLLKYLRASPTMP